MATKPTQGGTYNTWGTVLNAFLNVGHDADGTHKKSQMLTDMGYSPTAYAGGESVTLPNGMIIKMGYTIIGAGTGTITFGTPFPNGIVGAGQVIKYTSDTSANLIFTDLTVNDIDWATSASALTGFWWIVVGY